MKYCLMIFVACGCAVSQSPSRDVASYRENIHLNENYLKDQEALGAKEPWRFVAADLYCSGDAKKMEGLKAKLFPSYQIEASARHGYQKFVMEQNLRTFRFLACDNLYRENLRQIFGYYQQPFFIPKNIYEKNGKLTVKTVGYTVGKYESMVFNELSLGTAKTMAQKIDYRNGQRDKLKIPLEEAPFVINEMVTKNTGRIEIKLEPGKLPTVFTSVGNYAYFSKQVSRTECVTLVVSVFQPKEIDRIWQRCTQLTEVVPVLIGSQVHFLYTDLDESENVFKLKLRKLNSAKSRLQLDDSWNSKDVDNSKDATVMNIDAAKDLLSAANETPVPLQIASAAQKNGKNYLAVTTFNLGKNEIRVYEADSSFKNAAQKFIVPFDEAIFGKIEALNDSGLTFFTEGGQVTGDEKFFDFNSRQVTVVKKLYQSTTKSPLQKLIQRVYLYPVGGGRKLPMIVTYRKDFKFRSEKSFGVIKGYGGFNKISVGDTLEHLNQTIYERGGFTAFAIIRGGGELGQKFWKEAFGKNRIVGFQDFIAASEFLNKNGFAPKKRLIAEGWSNGGLLVLAVAMLRPDLYAGVVAGSPVTDVLNAASMDRAGADWMISDYGNLKDEETKKFWQKMSPLQAMAATEELPPTLLRTADGDPNVLSVHSIALQAALLQRKDADKHFLYVQPNGEGHNPKTLKAQIEENSYIQSFMFRQLGLF